MTTEPSKRPAVTPAIGSRATVTVERVEQVDEDNSAASFEIAGGEVHLTLRDDLITAEGRDVLADLVAGMLSHYRLVEPLRLV